jgi:GTP-binding protein
VGDHAPDGREALNDRPLDEAPDGEEDGPDREAEARRLFAQPCRFIAGAAAVGQIPPSTLPEVAFAGRSNVGKSSLINALTNRKSLALTSRTPGRTRQLNFFSLAESLILVDLPGYGYARASKTAIRNWTDLIDAFLAGRPVLRRTMLLVDARHGLKEVDQRVMSLLETAAVPFQVILTKSDTLDAETLDQKRRSVAREIAKWTPAHPVVLPTSAKDGIGIPEVRLSLAALADWSSEASRRKRRRDQNSR